MTDKMGIKAEKTGSDIPKGWQRDKGKKGIKAYW